MIKNIQYLRFIAAFLVVCAHANLQIYDVPSSVTNLGGFGVDIFFIISGFIMPFILYGGLYRKDAVAIMGPASFMWRRITRIWPMYCFTISVVVLVSWLVMNGKIDNVTNDLAYFFNGSKMDGAWYVQTLTFTHWTRPPILGIGWTLQVEFMFYTAIAVVLLFRAQTLATLEVGLVVFFFAAMLLVSNPQVGAVATTFANPMIVEFMLGIFLYRLVSGGTLMPRSVAIAVAVLAIPLFLFVEHNGLLKIPGLLYRPVAWGMPAFLLVWAALSLERETKESKMFGLLGDASYSLYLVHGFVAPLFLFFWMRAGLDQTVNIWIYLACYLLLCHAAGISAHLYLEKPLNTAIRKYTRAKPKCVTS